MKEILLQKLTETFSPKKLEIIDESHKHRLHMENAFETHFKITIVSEKFNGISLIARQRLVYDLIKEEMQHKIHAISLKCIAISD